MGLEPVIEVADACFRIDSWICFTDSKDVAASFHAIIAEILFADMSTSSDDIPFEAIAQYVGAHQNFSQLSEQHKLFFYALYKTTKSRAPAHSISYRVYLFIFDQLEYQKWLAWWTVSQKYGQEEAVQRYCAAAQEVDAFPPPDLLMIMRTSSRGKGTSQMVVQGEQNMSIEMDPLIDACEKQETEVIESWLRNGGNVDIRNEEDTTLLHFAVDSEAYEIVRLLINNNVNVNAIDDQNMTALDSALLNEFQEIAELLKKYGAQEKAEKE